MKLYRFLIAAVAILLVGGIVFFAWCVHARMVKMEYEFEVDAVLAACSVANGGEPVTDPTLAVVSSFDGQRHVIVPGNYKALSSWLRKDAAAVPSLFFRIERETALNIVFCSEARLWAEPRENGDVVMVLLETGGKSYYIRTDGGNQWKSLLGCATEGTYHDDNLPAE